MKKFSKSKILTLLLPAFLFVGGISLVGIFESFIQSIENSGLSIYKRLIFNDEYRMSFFYTFKFSFISVGISIALSLIVIYLIYDLIFYKRKKVEYMLYLLKSPMIMPYMVSAFLVFLIFSQGGYLSRILFNFHIIDDLKEAKILVNDEFAIGIIMTYVWKLTPFFLVMIYPALIQIASEEIDMARNLGGSKLKIFFRVIIPYIKNTTMFSSVMAFIFTFTSFEVPYILGVSYPKALAVLIYEKYFHGSGLDMAMAQAANFLIILMGIASWFAILFVKGLRSEE